MTYGIGRVIPTSGALQGFAGTVSSSRRSEEVSRAVDSGSADIPFGSPVIQGADFAVTLAGATLTAVAFGGIAVRQVQTMLSYPDQGAGGKYAAGQAATIQKTGASTVKVCVGSPTSALGVYVRITANSGVAGAVVGGFEARSDDDSGKCILLANCRWASTKDANGEAELVQLYAVTA